MYKTIFSYQDAKTFKKYMLKGTCLFLPVPFIQCSAIGYM